MVAIITDRDRIKRNQIKNGPWAINHDHPLADAFQCGAFVLEGYVVFVGAQTVQSQIISSNTRNILTEYGVRGFGKTSTSNVVGHSKQVYAPTRGWGGVVMTYNTRVQIGSSWPVASRSFTAWWDSFGFLAEMAIDASRFPVGTWPAGVTVRTVAGTANPWELNKINSATLVVTGNAGSDKIVYSNGEVSGSTTTNSGVRFGFTAPTREQMFTLGVDTPNVTDNYFGTNNADWIEQWGSGRIFTADEVKELHEQPFWWLYTLERVKYFIPRVVTIPTVSYPSGSDNAGKVFIEGATVSDSNSDTPVFVNFQNTFEETPYSIVLQSRDTAKKASVGTSNTSGFSIHRESGIGAENYWNYIAIGKKTQ